MGEAEVQGPPFASGGRLETLLLEEAVARIHGFSYSYKVDTCGAVRRSSSSTR